MPILTSDLHVRLSGGAANASGNASLGGAKSSVQAGTNLHDLFDVVSGAEGTAGDVEYRCVYLHNADGARTYVGSKVWLQANTPSASTQLAIGLGTAAINATEQTIADESTAPSGVTFSEPATEGAALTIGDLLTAQHKAVWLRRTINAATPAISGDAATLRFSGESVA